MGRTLRHITLICSASLVASIPAAAQLQSNSSLKGSYWVRYLGVNGAPNYYAQSFAGTMVFDGNGSFTVSGSGYYFSGSTQALLVSPSGTYQVQSSGAFSINNPFTQDAVNLFGGVGVNGIAVGSSTDSCPQCYEDLFVAIPQTTSASAATLNGTYRVAGLEFAGGSLTAMRNTFFNMTANGSGSLGNITVAGTSMALNNAPTTQTSAAATYTMTAPGNGTITFPAPAGVTAANQLISGGKYLYVSQDGSFFISGSPTGFDMQVGVKAISTGGAALLSGLYFTSSVENDDLTGVPFSYQGAVNEIPSIQNEFYHWRYQYDASSASDYTFTDFAPFTANDDGTSSGPDYLFAEGGGGNYALVAGTEGEYYLTVNVKVPPYSGSGVFLDPAGVVNAASSAPFTAQISPGEVITLYGSGFTASPTAVTAPSPPLPTTLGSVQVTINSVPVPLSLVSSGQINAWVPYTSKNDGSLLSIQVLSNGAQSNTVQEYSGLFSPGVFVVTHTDGQTPVTAANPAKVGEVLVAYSNGLGPTTTAVAVGSSSPALMVASPITVNVVDANGNYTPATIAYQGLAPGEPAGYYQVNFTVPSGVTLNATGVTNFQLDIVANDYDENLQTIIPISH